MLGLRGKLRDVYQFEPLICCISGHKWTGNPENLTRESPRSKSWPKIDTGNEHTWRRTCRMIHRWTSQETWCWSTSSKPIKVIGILNIYPGTSACFEIAVTWRWTHIIHQFHVIDCYITLVTRTSYSFEYHLEFGNWSDGHLSKKKKNENHKFHSNSLGPFWVNEWCVGKKKHSD